MAHSSSTSSFSQWRWLAYLLLVSTVWTLYAIGGGAISDFAEMKYGAQIMAATKSRVFDPSRFVQQRLFDTAYLTTVSVAAVAVFEAMARILRQFVASNWRFLHLTVIAFLILNAACSFAGQSALYWMSFSMMAPSLRLANAKMSEQVLWENADGKTGMLLGSSQANAQVGVESLNQALLGDPLFADLSYHGGHPINVLMLQSGWQRSPDIAVWYVSILDLFSHLELGAGAQSLMNAQTQADLVEFGGDKAIGSQRMRFGRIGRALPLFRIRREAEAVVLGCTGTPPVASYRARHTDREISVQAKLSHFHDLLTYGDGANYELAAQLQAACIQRIVERFDRQGTKLVIIAGHVHPMVESLLPSKRDELMDLLNGLASKHRNVTLIDEELPRATAGQYSDLTHLGEKHRTQYTEAVLNVLRKKGIL